MPYEFSSRVYDKANKRILAKRCVSRSRQAIKKYGTYSQVLGVWSTSYIPKGTRFGPLVGQVYTKDSVPADANRKYFWRVRII